MEYQYIKKTVRHVVQLLVEQRYDELYKNDFEKRVDIKDLIYAIETTYKLILTFPPEKVFNEMQIFETNTPGLVLIDIYLWCEGKMSDITLSLDIYSQENDKSYSIQDVRML